MLVVTYKINAPHKIHNQYQQRTNIEVTYIAKRHTIIMLVRIRPSPLLEYDLNVQLVPYITLYFDVTKVSKLFKFDDITELIH